VAALAATVVPFPACDPATLTPARRQVLTGTTDAGFVRMTVAPGQVAVSSEEDTVVTFTLTNPAIGSTAFTGTASVAVSALPPEVMLAMPPTPDRVVFTAPSQTFSGTFVLRAVGTRVDPATLLVTLTSTGTAGSVVVDPPVPVVITGVRSRLNVSCQRSVTAGFAPLEVQFTAQPSNCEGDCRFQWEFGDGGTAEERNPVWTYERAGRYRPTVTLTDGREGQAVCSRAIEVFERAGEPGPIPTPTPFPTPTPSPTTNRPPVVADTTVIVVPGQPLQRRILAAVVDPDPSDTVRWTAEVFAGTPSPTTFTPPAGNGASLSTLFTAQAAGSYAIRLTGIDNHGATGAFTFTLTVP
jgi:hypothetical protein